MYLILLFFFSASALKAYHKQGKFTFRSDLSLKASYETKFTNLARLYSDDFIPVDEILGRLKSSHVMVIGCGGVGSWACEALARSVS